MTRWKYSWLLSKVLLLVLICLSGCIGMKPIAWVPLYQGMNPANASISFTALKGTVSPDVFSPSSVSTNPKTGESCGTIILGFPLAKATVLRAAQKAGIKKISSIDYSFMNILDIYAEYCVIVKGE